MDIQKIISDVVAQLTGKKDLIDKFMADPAAAIKELTGLSVDAEQLIQIVKGVSEKLGIDADDVLKNGKGLLDKLKGFFGK